MIWVDSSFAIEWLLGASKAAKVSLPSSKIGVLAAQYAEIFVFFGRRIADCTPVVEQLEALRLEHPSRQDLQEASRLYLKAKRLKGKASIADALLAAVAGNRKEAILSFDQDFIKLGFQEEDRGIWRMI